MTLDPFLERFEQRRAAREAADRSFPLAGETLTHRAAVAPEVGMRLEAVRQQVLEQLGRVRAASEKMEKAAARNGGERDTTELEAAVGQMTVTDEDMLQIADETVLDCLEPESVEAWWRIRRGEGTQALLFDEVFEVADYLLGRVAGIPTSAPADSSDGRTETGKPSKAKSSSRARTPAASG